MPKNPGDRGRSKSYYDKDIVFQGDAPPKGKLLRLPSPSLAPVRDEQIQVRQSGSLNRQRYDDEIAFKRPNGGGRALDAVDRVVRREEEGVQNVLVIDSSDKGRRFIAQKSNEDIRRDRRERFPEIQAEREVRQRKTYEHREIDKDFASGISLDSWRLRDHSRQEPRNPLSLYEGETPPITNRDPFHKTSNENRQGHSDYYSTTANNNRDFAETRKPEIAVSHSTTRSSAHSSLPLRQDGFFPKASTTSALPPYGALVQSAGITKQASQPQPSLGVSVGERTQRSSTKDEQEDMELVQETRECKLSRESDVRCEHLIPPWLYPTTEAPRAPGVSEEQIDDRRVGTDQCESEDSVECSQDSGSHEFSHRRTNTSDAATTSQSECSSASPSQSPYASFDLTIAQAKHELMVTLMKEVYAMFDSEWKLSARTCANSQQASSGGQALPSKLAAPRNGKNSKKRSKDRDSSPPGDDNGKRRKRDDPDAGLQNKGRLFACPFHKYDPYKYSLNSDTGAVYRTCLGPGFTSISHVKQHLKRNHGAPIQCHRCWLVMADRQEMVEHANLEPRCDRRIGQPEGVDPEKLDHIFSTRGPTWEKIYEILFPGAPIPSPYFEAQVQLPESFPPPSPATQELEEFEAYNRRALPRLVEANLQAMVDTKMVPIEEDLRRLLVDIVRRCQSIVAESFRVTRSPRKVMTDSPQQSSSQAISPLPPRGETLLTDSQLLAPTIADTTLGFFEEPRHVHVEAGPSCPRLPEGTDRLEPPQNQFTDSGYGGFPEACDCDCHLVSEIDDTVNDASSCGDCILKHFDILNFSWGDLSRQSE